MFSRSAQNLAPPLAKILYTRLYEGVYMSINSKMSMNDGVYMSINSKMSMYEGVYMSNNSKMSMNDGKL